MKSRERKFAVDCYRHLGGILGEVLFNHFVSEGWIVKQSEKRDYCISDAGKEGFSMIGLDLSPIETSKRKPVNACCDRMNGMIYDHTGSHLGSLLLSFLLRKKWLVPIENKEFDITPAGIEGLDAIGIKITPKQ